MDKESINNINEERYETAKEKLAKVRITHFIKGDSYIWIATTLLMGLSLLVIFSSTTSLVYKHHPDNPMFYLFRRMRHVILALAMISILYHFNFKKWFYNLIRPFFILCLVLLVVTLFFGRNVNEANRSLGIFQASDFAKVALILITAKSLAMYKDVVHRVKFIPTHFIAYKLNPRKGRSEKERKWREGRAKYDWKMWTKFSIPLLLPVILTFLFIAPANLSTALITATMAFVLMIIGGVYIGEIVKLAGAGLLMFTVAAPIIGLGRVSTWANRLIDFLTGNNHFQTIQAKTAIAEGVIPQGPGGSVLRASLPRAESDFMFAVIIEEYGIIFAIIICLIYLWILQRAVYIARRHTDRFEALVCVGLAFFLSFQALIHCMVNVNLLPVTGLVLPFLSNGGSGLVSMSIAVAIILNISTHIKKT